MNFLTNNKFNSLSRLICSANSLRITRNVATRRKAPELPTQRGQQMKVSGFGKFLMLIPIATFSLGTWQVKRKMWKENLIKEMESKLKMNPLDLPDNLDDLENMEYQTVKARGRFIHDREMFLGPRSLITQDDEEKGGGVFSKASNSGYYVVTPFKLEGREETILVNRGWVSRKNLNPSTRKNGQIEGIVEVEGIVRLNEPRPQFSPEHRSGPFLYRDVQKMCQLSGSDPYFIDAKYDPNLKDGPIGGQTRVTLRNEHLSYIITWYSLSGITGYLWWRQIVKRVPI
ncbi:SURF1-like protein [Chironomus tepperi]|uniref:SURF1-like protein n=1 Tax=Chironomus tepperi TaxID=113505 RepID=UPI00391F8387